MRPGRDGGTVILGALVVVGGLLLVAHGLPDHAAPRVPNGPAMAFGDPAVLTLGRSYTRALYAGAADRLWASFAPAAKREFKTAERITGFRTKVDEQLGPEVRVLGESVLHGDGQRSYRRRALFTQPPMPFLVTWVLDGQNRIAGYSVTPGTVEADSPYLGYRTKAELRLPFAGAWTVAWGGRSVDQNYHAAYPDQRFAYDLEVREQDATHQGDGRRNEDYYCFGRAILAPAAGTVAEAVDGVADNAPGQMNADQPFGNHVILDLGQGEYAVFGHLRQGSVAVQAGQRVTPGQQLGLCGNSGHSSAPHLHFHLQDAAGLYKGKGLPAQFHHLTVDGRPVDEAEPGYGQVIALNG